MIKGFREFILRGNVVDLAVGVVIGVAFGSVVTALVNGVFNPVVGAIFNSATLAKLSVDIPTASGKPAQILYGTLIAAVIQFLLTALVIYFFVVFPLNRLNERTAARLQAKRPQEETAPAAPTETELLAEIRDLLRREPG